MKCKQCLQVDLPFFPSEIPYSPDDIPRSIPSSIPSCLPPSIPPSIPSSIPSCLPPSIPPSIPSSIPSCLPPSIPPSIPSCLPPSMPSCLPYSTSACLSEKKLLPFPSKFASSVDNAEIVKVYMEFEQCGLICSYCGHCYYLRMEDGSIMAVRDALDCGDSRRVGWRKATTPYHRWIQAVLNNVVYSQNEAPDPDKKESNFSLPPYEDEVWLYWDHGRAVAFCTLKVRGTTLPGSFMETYAMDVLDTIFVRKSHRRIGITQNILKIIFSTPNKNEETDLMESNVGFSSPLSNGMLLLLVKMLRMREDWRWRAWQVTGGAGEGEKINIWITAKQEMRKREIWVEGETKYKLCKS